MSENPHANDVWFFENIFQFQIEPLYWIFFFRILIIFLFKEWQSRKSGKRFLQIMLSFYLKKHGRDLGRPESILFSGSLRLYVADVLYISAHNYLLTSFKSLTSALESSPVLVIINNKKIIIPRHSHRSKRLNSI